MVKVLIADDDINVIKCLETLIPWEKLGCELVAKAYNGVKGMELVEKLRPQVVITDVKMPVMDGVEFCRKIREISEEITVIFISAYEDFAAAQDALRYGVAEYILKPLNREKLEQLTQLLQSAVQKHEHMDYFRLLATDSHLSDTIRFYLGKKDVLFFTCFFEEFSECSASDITSVREACIRLMEILYDYFHELGIEKTVVEKGRLEKQRELYDMSRKRDMVFYVTKKFMDYLQFQVRELKDVNRKVIIEITQYIEDNYTDPLLAVAQVAEKFGFSPDYLTRIYKQYAGISVGSHISELRMNRAKKLLLETELSVNDIAQMSGFSSPNYFIRAFKKKTGNPPGEYREIVRGMELKGE